MVTSTAVAPSAVARVVGIKQEYVDLRAGGILLLPQRLAVVGQGSTAATYATTKRQVTSAAEAGGLYGFGSPLHLAVKQLLPINGDGVGTIPVTLYPMEDNGSGVVSDGGITPTIVPTAAAAYTVLVNNIPSAEFVIAVGDVAADVTLAMSEAINANVDMPIIAVDGTTVVTFTSKWAGTSANDIFIEIVGSTTVGNSFVIVQANGGLVNPVVTDSLAQVGNVWETMVLNCLDLADSTNLDLYQTFGDGRYGALVKKPLIVFTGLTPADVSAAITISDARKTDKINSQLIAVGSNDLPFVVAARQLSRIVVRANNNPPRDYGSMPAQGLTPGTDGEQFNYIQRNTAVEGGSSTVEVEDGVINLSDTITFYHPTGDPIPAYRFVVDIVKLQNIIFNTNLIFATDAWDGAPLIPDADPTVNPDAKKPKMAKAEIAAMLDSLGLNALISDPKTAKASIIAVISDQNPKRLDISFTVQLSGNSNIISIDLDWGFFFGVQPIVG